MSQFARYIGIDYSGAATPNSCLTGLRVYEAEGTGAPSEVLPPTSQRKYWTRAGVAEWLSGRLSDSTPTLAGIDHGFSFPLKYFDAHGLAQDWPAFLDDFHMHWPTDEVTVESIRDGRVGGGGARTGNARWRRLTEERTKRAKSVFHFDVQGSVAKSTHAGLPWLRMIRQHHPKVHSWPFDGWDIPAGRSAVAEVYPSLWSSQFERGDRTPDQHDAFTIAACLARADADGTLSRLLNPQMSEGERTIAAIEGWILGVD